MEDAEAVCNALREIIPRLRAMSPVWDKIEKGEAKPLLG